MTGALLGGFRRLAAAVHERSPLPGAPRQIADAIWAQVHPTMYRRLVSDCGLSDAAFRAHQMGIVRTLAGIGRQGPRDAAGELRAPRPAPTGPPAP